MDSLAPRLGTPPPGGPGSRTATAMDAAFGHEWVVLRGCALGGGPTPLTIDRVLIHPRIGIALVEAEGEERAKPAVAAMRQTLDAANFRKTFGAHPPIVQPARLVKSTLSFSPGCGGSPVVTAFR